MLNNSQSKTKRSNTIIYSNYTNNISKNNIFDIPINTDKNTSYKNKISIEDFNIIKVLGTGSFGKVYLVNKDEIINKLIFKKYYAMKVLKKLDMIKRNKIKQTITEKNILQQLDHPYILSLKYGFQDNSYIYLITDYCCGGELFYHMSRVKRFNERAACFYTAQIVLALEYLHNKKILYKE